MVDLISKHIYKSLGPVSNKDLSQNVFHIRHGLTNLSGHGVPILLPRMSINHHVRPNSLRINRWNFVQLYSLIHNIKRCLPPVEYKHNIVRLVTQSKI